MDTTRERIYREKNGTQQQQQRQKKTNDRYSMRRYWMTVLMQEGEKGWHIVQNRFHMVVALAYSKLCSALLCNNVYTIHHPHHPCTRCAVYTLCIYMVCVWERHICSKSTTHCAQIFFNHVELMSKAFIGLVNVVPSPHPLLLLHVAKRERIREIRFFHPSKWFYHWHDEYSVFSFFWLTVCWATNTVSCALHSHFWMEMMMYRKIRLWMRDDRMPSYRMWAHVSVCVYLRSNIIKENHVELSDLWAER